VRTAAATLLVALLAAATLVPAAQDTLPTFRSELALVTVGTVVRDRAGEVLRGLTADDFELFEDGVRQQIVLFAFQDVVADHPPDTLSAAFLAGVEEGPAAPDPDPLEVADVTGRRLIVMLFDLSAMTPDDIRRSVDAGVDFLDTQMSPADLVAVATVGWRLQVLEDFTSDRGLVRAALGRLAFSDAIPAEPAVASTMATDEAEAATLDPPDDESPPDPHDDRPADELSELELFNNDLRLRALRTLAETLAPIEQRKAIVYFSGGLARGGHDNQVELRAAINAAVRGNVAIYPVDARGLQAVVPGGDATRQSGRGASLFSGADVVDQYDRLARSQETLVTLAADTGGRAFLDTNDFGEAFARVQHDLTAYYLLGYTSSNTTADGRFRRIQVRVSRPDVRVETRPGYYADRDFAHTSRSDREMQLRDQLEAAVSSTDLPVLLSARWFRLDQDEYVVAMSVAVPGVAVPVPEGQANASLDFIGQVWDEQDRTLATLRDTVRVGADAAGSLAAAHIQYQTSLRLPPGRYWMKVVARENTGGRIGSFEIPLVVPSLPASALAVSPVVISTQTLPVRGRAVDQPLVRNGVRLLPNATHVIGREQVLSFYYEVYGAAAGGDGRAHVQSSVSVFRGLDPVLETPLVSRTTRDGRGAVPIILEMPASSLEPGLYTAQVTVIDAVSRRFVFPRVVFFVR
jgi:VWFA-related protein